MPRVLDIDVLLFETLVLDEPGLVLPHPRMRERRFVLEPLAELDPELRLPPDGASVRELLGRPEVAAQELVACEQGPAQEVHRSER
jgi:7,8-dihydro-6-hydroxymethylpterin-pyrophosphokinase